MRFKVGGVYNACTEYDSTAGGVANPIKVTRICDGKIWFYAPDLVFEDGDEPCSIGLNWHGHECTGFIEKVTEKNYNEEYFDECFVDATELHVLNPWFPKT